LLMKFLVLKLLLTCRSECGALTQEKEDIECEILCYITYSKGKLVPTMKPPLNPCSHPSSRTASSSILSSVYLQLPLTQLTQSPRTVAKYSAARFCRELKSQSPVIPYPTTSLPAPPFRRRIFDG